MGLRGPAPGQRPSGRQKGAINKDKHEARALIEAACPGWDPLQAMAKAAMTGHFDVWDPVTDAPMIDPVTNTKMVVPISDKTRGTLMKEVNEYCHAKLRSIELRDSEGNPVNLGLTIGFVKPDAQPKG